MKNPSDLMKFVQLRLSDMGATVWRNNTASGWTGKSIPLAPKQVYRAKGNERLVFNANWLRAGLCEGSSDLIGFKTITVTPDMVGKKVAIFHAWEVKSCSGRLTKEQLNFINYINENGGFATTVRSAEEARHSFYGGE
ncbi:VRR-NUC domain-containing protein [Bartonella sp. B17]